MKKAREKLLKSTKISRIIFFVILVSKEKLSSQTDRISMLKLQRETVHRFSPPFLPATSSLHESTTSDKTYLCNPRFKSSFEKSSQRKCYARTDFVFVTIRTKWGPPSRFLFQIYISFTFIAKKLAYVLRVLHFFFLNNHSLSESLHFTPFRAKQPKLYTFQLIQGSRGMAQPTVRHPSRY